MISRSPAEVYVRYLLCHPDGFNNSALKEKMAELKLYCPLDKQLDGLRKKYKPPTPFFPKSRTHTASIGFMKNAGIYSLFFPDQSTRYALAILNSPKARAAVEQQLAQRAPAKFIVAGLDKKLQFACSMDGVNKYRYFFFNDDIATRSEMQQAVDVVSNTWMGADDKDLSPAHLAAEKRARWKDPLITALSLPTCAPAQVVIAMQNGYLPKDLQYDAGRSMQDLSFLLLNQAALKVIESGPNAARDAKEFITAAQAIHAMLADVHTPGEQARAALERDLRLVSDSNKPKGLKELSQGNYTIDIQPLGKTEDDSVESLLYDDDE